MRSVLALLVVALLNATAVPAAEPQVRPSGIFSNLRFNPESGDLGGTELLVIPGPGDLPTCRVLVQISEGAGPYSALVPLTAVGDHFEFTLPSDGVFPESHYSLRTTAKDAILTSLPSQRTEHLRRGKSYWQ